MDKFLNKAWGLIQSKTFWINLLMFILVLIPRMAELPRYTLSPEITGFIILVVNTILRWITKKSLEEK